MSDRIVGMAISLRDYISVAYPDVKKHDAIVDSISRSLLDGAWNHLDILTVEQNYTLSRMCGEIWKMVNNESESYRDMLDYMQKKIVPVFVEGYGVGN